MLTERDYQPSLLWALIEAGTKPKGTPPHHHPEVYIYRKDKPGAFYLHGPRLYWDADVGDDRFNTCDQDALWTNRESLGEVVVVRLGAPKAPILLGRTYEEAIQRLTTPQEAP